MGGECYVSKQETRINHGTACCIRKRDAEAKKKLGVSLCSLHLPGRPSIHKFYLQETTQGILYLLLGIFSFVSMVAGEFSSLVSFGASGNRLFTVGLFCSIALGLLILIDLFTLPGQVRKTTESMENKS